MASGMILKEFTLAVDQAAQMYAGSIPREDIGKDAAYLHMTEEAFIKRYLCRNSITGAYETIHSPCDFLQENGECLLGECKPENCVSIPIRISRNVYGTCTASWRL